MMKSDNLIEILDWLSKRMNPREKRILFDELKVETIADLEAIWNQSEVKERIKLEVQRRTTVADCTFKLQVTLDNFKVTKNKFIPRTFIDMTSQEED